MLLRAQPIGKSPSLRWVIQDIKKNTFWDGNMFTKDWTRGVKYAHPSDACGDMQLILKKIYSDLPRHRYVVPIEIEFYGDRSKETIARYLHQATLLNVQTSQYGNGPGECLVLPTIHWGRIRQVEEFNPLSDIENPAVEWGLENENENE